MKKIVIGFLMLLGMLIADDIVWQKDLDSALELAKKENRLLMVMVEGEHCRWCKKMRYRTLSNDAVVAKLKPFVNIRVMQEDKAVMKELPKIQGVPTIFFMYPDKEVIETAVGYFNVADFLSFFVSVDRKVRQKKQNKQLSSDK
ncbi:thioredoxin family protein [Sulfurovum sp. ST-21]|uniref:DUF255 domain-containing protein n=1 Tax=Sulfurovum indicum TaxID=2779528 RepID=A0A7M1S2A7_9BACT|nr:DUF255 domain-containing protein [Sulfurovum indicum]QOR61466.1 DUF255 domain-containing protein [Sulfurovum indicum]